MAEDVFSVPVVLMLPPDIPESGADVDGTRGAAEADGDRGAGGMLKSGPEAPWPVTAPAEVMKSRAGWPRPDGLTGYKKTPLSEVTSRHPVPDDPGHLDACVGASCSAEAATGGR